jgi:hypothetical protein
MTGKYPNATLCHVYGHINGQFALWLAQYGIQSGIEIQQGSRLVEVDHHCFERV